jgi:tRNA(His) 5'-end guanylyltransferase
MNDTLGDRMKRNYESRQRFYLTRRTPVVVRVDGRAFHTLTKGLRKPFDEKFIDAMILAAYHVFGEAQGCKIAYVQSDEASFVLTDYDDLQTQAWFDYNKSKIESVSAALMSVAFGRALRLMNVKELAVFDARAFNVPENEVANYLVWRAKDWHRNSVQMLAQSHFTHRELQGRNISQCLTMLDAIGRSWDRLNEVEKNGTFLVRECNNECNNECGADFRWRLTERTDVRDNYPEIAQLWDAVNPTT